MKAKIFISLALLTVLVTSCNKPVYMYYELTNVDKQMIPYELGQTVSFIDSEGQPFILTVTTDTTVLFTDREMDNLYLTIYRRVVRLQSDSLRISLSVTAKYPKDSYNTIDIDIRLIPSVYLHYDKSGNFLTNTFNFFHDSIEINGKVYYDVIEQKGNTQLFYNKTYGILQINRDGENFLTINE